ncbi:hypothetical protein [Cohnella caldifontis]|uniref:hypothetical protein n=1 Tax=Cohnella caldifontis TaxID=3027471 RepID=UPI0023EBBA5D|nr:hypothetical protein [Cohnella sp. YIM B05605]
MAEWNDMKQTIEYLSSEIARIETMAGTLSSVEHEHYRKLTGFEKQELVDIAVEEQSAARQLGTIKQMCLNMSRRLDGMLQSMEPGAGHEVH